MKEFCVQKGISYHLTVPRTPQLNGVSERMNRTITEKARAMIFGANLEKRFWGEAVLTATLLINLTPTKALRQNKTPYELWHNKKPQLKYLKVFGSTVYIHNKTRKTKFDKKSWKGILVGYEPNGYKVWNVETEKFSVVRDVIADETNFKVSRPVMRPEGVNLESSKDNKTDAPDCSSNSDRISSSSGTTASQNTENIKDVFTNITSYQKGGFKHKKLTGKILYTICKDSQPVATVEREGFQELIKYLAPNYKLPYRKTFSRRLDEKYGKISNDYKETLKSVKDITLTTDLWSDTLNTRSFLGITFSWSVLPSLLLLLLPTRTE